MHAHQLLFSDTYCLYQRYLYSFVCLSFSVHFQCAFIVPKMITAQPWSVRHRRQQICEMLRNKGIICKDYICSGQCPRGTTCPYMHIHNGETRQVPRLVCNFFAKGVCLRERCMYFHGTPLQLSELHAKGAQMYRPQDYMKIALPPSEYLDSEGFISAEHDASTPVAITVVRASSEQYSLASADTLERPVVLLSSHTPPQQVPSIMSTASFANFEPVQYNYISSSNSLPTLTYTVSPSPPMATSGATLAPQLSPFVSVGPALQSQPASNYCYTQCSPILFHLR